MQAAVVAQQKAGDAQREVDAARRELGKFAAAAYREGGDLGGLSAFLSPNGPQDLIDRASAIDSIGDPVDAPWPRSARPRSPRLSSATGPAPGAARVPPPQPR